MTENVLPICSVSNGEVGFGTLYWVRGAVSWVLGADVVAKVVRWSTEQR